MPYSVARKLKALRERAEPHVTIRALAERLGMPPSTYAAYEDPNKFKKPILPFDLAKRIAGELEGHGISAIEVMRLAGLEAHTGGLASHEPEKLLVTGAVAAGVWREETRWPLEDQYEIEVGPNPIAGGERFAVKMEGYSMDRTILPGSELECVRVQYGVVEPMPGDLVIAERTAHDLTELTCKRLHKDGDDWLLYAESTRPEFAAPIHIGQPSLDHHSDDEVRIVGIVLKSHQQFFTRTA
jgi:SOS-response transcriptional repressor LexA